MARKTKQYDKALVLVQFENGKPLRCFVFNEDAKTKRGYENHAKKQASFMSHDVRATVLELPPVQAADQLRLRGIEVNMMGLQKDSPEGYFNYDGRKPDLNVMREYGFIPSTTDEVAIPF